MLEQDYLMRIFLQFAEILRRSWFKARDERDPKAAADMLENAVGDAVDIDGATLLSLAPESMAGILQVSGTDPRVTEYVARSLMLASAYLREAGEDAVADLRLEQARAQAEEQARALLKEAEEKAARNAQTVTAQTRESCEALRGKAEGRLAEAAQSIVRRVVNS